MLGKYVSHNTVIPTYIIDAIIFAHSIFKHEVIYRVLEYRVERITEDLLVNRAMVNGTTNQAHDWYTRWNNYLEPREASLPVLQEQVKSYCSGVVTLDEIKTTMLTSFPNDAINGFLERV